VGGAGVGVGVGVGVPTGGGPLTMTGGAEGIGAGGV